jgi:hypothetical protein
MRASTYKVSIERKFYMPGEEMLAADYYCNKQVCKISLDSSILYFRFKKFIEKTLCYNTPIFLNVLM